jgi:hypothetical protein
LFITGNPDWLVSAGFKARRLFALHASEAHVDQIDFFADMDKWWLKEDGREAVMYHYLNLKSDIQLRRVQVTHEQINQKMESLKGLPEWLYSLADSKEMPYGELVGGNVGGNVHVIKAILINEYNTSSSGKRLPLLAQKFGLQFKKLVPCVKATTGEELKEFKLIDNRNIWRDAYDIPDLPTFRRALEANLGGKIKWTTADGPWNVLHGNIDFDFSLYKDGYR